MALRRLGVPKECIYGFINTFQNTKHFLCTTFSDTDKYFLCEKDTMKFNGAGQGNGFSPAIWAAVSTVLLCILREEGYCPDEPYETIGDVAKNRSKTIETMQQLYGQ